jgi:hypothetical protein
MPYPDLPSDEVLHDMLLSAKEYRKLLDTTVSHSIKEYIAAKASAQILYIFSCHPDRVTKLIEYALARSKEITPTLDNTQINEQTHHYEYVHTDDPVTGEPAEAAGAEQIMVPNGYKIVPVEAVIIGEYKGDKTKPLSGYAPKRADFQGPEWQLDYNRAFEKWIEDITAEAIHSGNLLNIALNVIKGKKTA